VEEANRLHSKKEQVLGSRLRLGSTGAIIVLFIVAMIGVGVFLVKSNLKNGPGLTKDVARGQISDPLDYSTRRYDMKSIKVVETDKNVIFSLADIKKYRMVGFTAKNRAGAPSQSNVGNQIPLMAYITPSGSLNTVVSYCEPCRATQSHTETDGTLTCNVCGTKWNLEDEAPVSGACSAYPPEPIKAEVRGGKVYLDRQEIASWKPRVES